MGFMDKAKEAALQAKQKSQQLAQQGQAKVQEMQQGRSEAELLRALGEAVYAEQRHGGGHDAVAAALDALDQHYASAPPSAPAADGAAATDAQPAPAAPAPTPAPAAPAPEATPGGTFTLDNL